MNKITICALISAALLSGCASVSRTYGPDGREALTLNCSGLARNWGMCYKAAGDACGTAGYDVLGRGGDGGYVTSGYGSAGGQWTNSGGSFGGNFGGFGGSVITRTLIVQCRSRDS